MLLRELKIEGFRNLADTELRFDDRGQLILGDNGQGKTNLLEAIYYLTILRSFRGAADQECLRFGGEHFNLRAHWLDDLGRPESLSAGYDGRRKKLVLSGKEVRSLSQAFGIFKSVVLTPDDINIVQGSPGVRRRYLDIVLSIISPPYLDRLKRYRKALATRNYLLRRETRPEVILPWEEQLAEHGTELILERERLVGELAGLYRPVFERLGNGERGTLCYRCSLLEGRPEGLEEAAARERLRERFSRELERRRPVERTRGMTLSGPQTDELAFGIEGRPLRCFGSQGQQRSAVIALKLAEARLVERRQGLRPVLLLDDIFAELDRRRCLSLLDELVERHQSFITSPRREELFDRLGHLPVLRIEQGVIRAGAA